jgi:hypothetical protein
MEFKIKGYLFLLFGLGCLILTVNLISNYLRAGNYAKLVPIENISILSSPDDLNLRSSGSAFSIADTSLGRVGLVYNDLSDSGYAYRSLSMSNKLKKIRNEDMICYRFFPSKVQFMMHAFLQISVLLVFGFLFTLLGFLMLKKDKPLGCI